ncbi:MAG: C40 family peptidase [Lachnospiraceae bacterium]|nr:C40 family peptidase [Lachnospiraceae bacterium]
MRSKALIKIFVALFVVISITAFSRTGNAEAGVITGEKALGGVSYYLNLYYNEVEDIEGASGNLLDDSVQIPDNVAIANVNVYLNIRSGPGTEYNMIGCLPKDGMCVVIEDLDGWAKIESGNVTGYVSKDYLIMGEEGRKKAEEITMLMAKVEAGTVNFRSEPDTTTDDNILATVSRGESLIVIEETIVSKDDSQTLWVKVYVDDMEGYIAKDLVSVNYDWVRAVSISTILETGNISGISALRAAVIIEAKKHIGLKYVWGGNSLKTGADCSGFCRAVYSAVGIDISRLPRTSYDLAASSRGRTVKLSEAKPGDLVFYGDSSGHVNHVAIYMGDGQIIHESGRAYGCRISSVYYRSIIKVRSFLD